MKIKELEDTKSELQEKISNKVQNQIQMADQVQVSPCDFKIVVKYKTSFDE